MSRFRNTYKKHKYKLIPLSCAVLLTTICVFVMSVFADDGKTHVYLDLYDGDIVIGTATYNVPEDPEVPEVPEVEENTDQESISGYLNDEETISYKLLDGILTITYTGEGNVVGDTEMPDYNISYDEDTETYTSTNLSPFYGNEYIERVEFVGNITKIGAYTFYNCPNLEGRLTITSTIAEIGDYAFSGNSYGNAPKFTIIYNDYVGEQTFENNIFYVLTTEDKENYGFTTYEYNLTDKTNSTSSNSSLNKYDTTTLGRGVCDINDANTKFVELMEELSYIQVTDYIEPNALLQSDASPFLAGTGQTINPASSDEYLINIPCVTIDGTDYYFISDNVFDLEYISSKGYVWENNRLTIFTQTQLQSASEDGGSGRNYYAGDSFIKTTQYELVKTGPALWSGKTTLAYNREIPTADIPEVTEVSTDEGGDGTTEGGDGTTEGGDGTTEGEGTTEDGETTEDEPDEYPGWDFTNIYTYYDETGKKITEEYDENTVFHITQTGYETTDTENLIVISGNIDVTVYLAGINIDVSSSDLQEVNTSDTYNGNRYGDAPILVENRGDTILVLADNTVNTVKANGNRAGVEKASASTNYDVEALVLSDWPEIEQDAELSDGALVITSEAGYEAIKNLPMIEVEEEIQYISTNDDGTMITTKEGNAVGDDCLYPVYDDEFTTVTVYKYDYTKLTDDYTTEDSGTLNAYGGSNGNANEGAGIGTRGATYYVAENNPQTTAETGMQVSVDLANLFIIGGNINSTAYGTHAGASAIGTGSGQATSTNYSEPSFGGSITNMNIYGGNITTTTYGAGAANIGGGFASNYVYLTIYGGTIDASSDMNLGNIFNDSTDDMNLGNISTEFTNFTTTGSEETDAVIADSTVWYLDTDKLITIKRGAGIGGGGGGTRTAPVAGTTVNIYGGDIEASSDVGAGIGTGGGGNNATGTDAIVNIYGGTIDATSSNGAAIGSGGAAGTGGGGEGTVNIYDGEITATIVARENEVNSNSNSVQTFEDLEGTGAAIGGAAGGTTGSGGDGVVTIKGGKVYAHALIGSGIGGGGSYVGTGGDAEITITGGDVTALSDGNADFNATGIGGGSSRDDNGGNVSSLIIREDDSDNPTIVNAISIGGGNSVTGKGGDVENFQILSGYVYVGSISGVDMEDSEGTGRIGGGRSTDGDGGDVVNFTIGTYSTELDDTDLTPVVIADTIGGGRSTNETSGSVGVYDEETESLTGGLTIYSGTITARRVGGGNSVNGDGGSANVTIWGGYLTITDNIGGGNSDYGIAGNGYVTTYGGTTVAGQMGSGLSSEYGYSSAKIYFHGGSINSMLTASAYTGGALMQYYDEIADEFKYVEKVMPETEVFLTRISYYNTDEHMTLLKVSELSGTVPTSLQGDYYDETVETTRTYTLTDVITDNNGIIYLWLPDTSIVTATTAAEWDQATEDYTNDNIEDKYVTYEGAIVAKSIDVLKYNCSRNYYGAYFPYTDRVTFYTDEDLNYPFAGYMSGSLTVPYGTVIEFWAQTTVDENDIYYQLNTYYSSLVEDESLMIELVEQSDSDSEEGYFHYKLTITTRTDLLFQTVDSNEDDRMAVDLSAVSAVVTDSSISINGYLLGEEDSDIHNDGSIYLTSSGISSANLITISGSEIPKEVYVNRLVSESTSSTIIIKEGDVNLTYEGGFDNSITYTGTSSAAVVVEDGATLNIENIDDASSLKIISTQSGVPAISGSGTVNITDNGGYLTIQGGEGSADVVAESFTYTNNNLTGAVPIIYEPTTGTLIGYYDTISDTLYEIDHVFTNANVNLIATTYEVLPTQTTYGSTENGDDKQAAIVDGQLVFYNLMYGDEKITIANVVTTRNNGEDTLKLTTTENTNGDYSYEEDGSNITIDKDASYGNLLVLVQFTGNLSYYAKDTSTEYNGEEQTFSFELVDPVNQVIEDHNYNQIVTTYYAVSDTKITATATDDLTSAEALQKAIEKAENDDTLVFDLTEAPTLTNIGKYYVYMKVEVTYTNESGEIITDNDYVNDYTKYAGPYLFEVVEATNDWERTLQCVSIVVDTELSYSAISELGSENVVYSFEYFDSCIVDEKGDPAAVFVSLPYTVPAEYETYGGLKIQADTVYNDEATAIAFASDYLNQFPGRYRVTATVPAGLVYATDVYADDGLELLHSAGDDYTDDNGTPYLGVYKVVNEEDGTTTIWRTVTTTNEATGEVTETPVEIKNVIMNYPEMVSTQVLFDVQNTVVYTISDRYVGRLSTRSDVQISLPEYDIGTSDGFTTLIDFQYISYTDDADILTFIVEPALPVGTEITIIDVTSYGNTLLAAVIDPKFYYFVVGEDDNEIGLNTEDDYYNYDTRTVFTSNDAVIMGTTKVWDYNEDVKFKSDANKESENNYLSIRSRYQFCVEFPEDTELSEEYNIELSQGTDELIEVDGSERDATIIDSDFTIVTSTADDPTLTVEENASSRGTIHAEITCTNLTSNNDVLAITLLDEDMKQVDFPTGATITLMGEEAIAVRGGFAVFDNIEENIERNLVITGLEEATYYVRFDLCINVDNKDYPMSNSVTDITIQEDFTVPAPEYSIYAELENQDTNQDDRVVYSAEGATLNFNVSYLVIGTALDEDPITITIQQKDENGDYIDIEDTTGWLANNSFDVDAEKTEKVEEIDITVPPDLDDGVYRINFTIDNETYPYNIIVTSYNE